MIDSNTYTGWVKWEPNNDEWSEILTEGTLPKTAPFTVVENEYVMLESKGEPTQFYCYEKGKLRKFTGGSISTKKDTTPAFIETKIEEAETGRGRKRKQESEKQLKGRAKFSRGKNVVITPKNPEQVCAFDLLKDSTKTVKLITGTWGTGKTLLLVSAGLEALAKGDRFDRIVWIRNNVDVKDTKDLGSLPGEVIDKLLPFLGPFIDHAGETSVKTMLTHGTLIVEPLQSLRGRNFERTLILCSEAENLTREHIQLIIARAASGSEVWFDADCRQRDKASFDKSKGVETLIERFAGQELFGYVHLIKSERSKTAALADLLNLTEDKKDTGTKSTRTVLKEKK